MARGRDRQRRMSQAGALPRLPGQRSSVSNIPPEALAKRPGFRADGIQIWEIEAFFLGAMCAEDAEYGPKLILDHMQGAGDWWKDIGHVMGFSRMAAGLWSLMYTTQGDVGWPLEHPKTSDPPTIGELREWARVKQRELDRFIDGQSLAAGEADLDPKAKEIVVDLARIKVALRDLDGGLRRSEPADPDGLRATLATLGKLDLELSDAFFRLGVLALRRRREKWREDSRMGPEYDPCPCGSGRLQGVCHGAPKTPGERESGAAG